MQKYSGHLIGHSVSMTHFSKRSGSNCFLFRFFFFLRLPPHCPIINTILVTSWLQQALGGSYLLWTTVKLTFKVQRLKQVITNLLAVIWLTRRFKKKKKIKNQKPDKQTWPQVPVYSFKSNLQRANQSHGTLLRKTCTVGKTCMPLFDEAGVGICSDSFHLRWNDKES